MHVPDWLDLDGQRKLVEACRGWARGPAPMRHTKRTADDVDGSPVTPMPEWLVEMGKPRGAPTRMALPRRWRSTRR